MNSHDQRMPLVGFFAKRKIKRGEEITFDYMLTTQKQSDVDKNECLSKKCGSKCRGSLYTLSNEQAESTQ